MKTLLSVLGILSAISLFSPAIGAPKYGAGTARLHDSHEFVQKNAAPDFWALIPYYVSQATPRYCSVATAAMIVNAARASLPLPASEKLALQSEILGKVNDIHWTQGMNGAGKPPTLDEMASLLAKSLSAYGVKSVKTSVVHLDAVTPEAAAQLHRALVKNEQSANDFIVLNFLQSIFTGDPEGAVGHFAPLAAFDASKRRGLILDPDRVYYEPYWIDEPTLLKGMATLDKDSGKNRGYIEIEIGTGSAPNKI